VRKAQWMVLFHPRSKRGVRGQELIEYALMAGFIVVSVAAFVPYQVTGPISTIFSKLQVCLTGWGNGS
jgi:Flp pilus assembly pilin Flp